MIAFRDFVPKVTTTKQVRVLFGITSEVHEYETFEAAVAAANEWLQQKPIYETG